MKAKMYSDEDNSRTDINGAWKPLSPLSKDFDFFSGDEDSFSFVSQKKDFYNAVDPLTAVIELGSKTIETVGKEAEALGNILTAKQQRKTAETKLAEIGGKRSAQLRECENNKAYKKFADPKYRRNKILGCQAEVNQRMDIEEAEQRDIIRKSLEIEQGKVSNQRSSQTSNQKNVWIGVGIVSLIGIYLLMKKK
jgi:hypothetical protein